MSNRPASDWSTYPQPLAKAGLPSNFSYRIRGPSRRTEFTNLQFLARGRILPAKRGIVNRTARRGVSNWRHLSRFLLNKYEKNLRLANRSTRNLSVDLAFFSRRLPLGRPRVGYSLN